VVYWFMYRVSDTVIIHIYYMDSDYDFSSFVAGLKHLSMEDQLPLVNESVSEIECVNIIFSVNCYIAVGNANG